MYTVPAWRGRGVAAAILAALERSRPGVRLLHDASGNRRPTARGDPPVRTERLPSHPAVWSVRRLVRQRLFREADVADGARLTHGSATFTRAAVEQAGLQDAGAAVARRAAGDAAASSAGAPSRFLSCSAGVDGAGKGETVNLLHEWMDPRWLHTHAYGPPSDEERERPEHWRFWRDLPPKGQIGILMNAWYAAPIDRRAHRVTPAAEFRRELQRIARLEQLLTDDGALILKFMMHLDRETQHARLKALERDPLTRWRVTAEQWRQARSYDELVEAEAHGGAADRCEPGAVDAGGRIRRTAPQPGRRARPPRSRDPAAGRRGRGIGGRAAAPRRQACSRRRPDARPGPARGPTTGALASLEHVARRSSKDHVRRRAGQGPGPPEPAPPESAASRALDHRRLRGLGCRGQGRRHPARRLGARRARVSGDSRRRAHRRGTRPALPVALLAAPVARRPPHGLRPLVVRPRAGGTRRRLRRATPNGSVPTPRSTTSKRSWSPTASSW